MAPFVRNDEAVKVLIDRDEIAPLRRVGHFDPMHSPVSVQRTFMSRVCSTGAPNEQISICLDANSSCRLAKRFCPVLAWQLSGVKAASVARPLLVAP